jgi:hypothetical protein
MNKHKVCAAAGVLAGVALLAGACVGTASAMASSNGGNRIGVIRDSGTAHVKKGALTAPKATKSGGVKQMALAGNRAGIVSGNGDAWGKGNGPNATWTWGSTWGNQAGAVQGNGSVKAGGPNAAWTWGSTWGNQAGAVQGNGSVKAGGHSVSWAWGSTWGK